MALPGGLKTFALQTLSEWGALVTPSPGFLMGTHSALRESLSFAAISVHGSNQWSPS